MHAGSEKSDDLQDSFYEELEQVFCHFPKYHMQILLGDFNAKVERDGIFIPTIWNQSLHLDSNDNGFRIVKLPHQKVSFLIARCSRTKTFISTPGSLLVGRLTTRLITYW
jgi:hypothetical protein